MDIQFSTPKVIAIYSEDYTKLLNALRGQIQLPNGKADVTLKA